MLVWRVLYGEYYVIFFIFCLYFKKMCLHLCSNIDFMTDEQFKNILKVLTIIGLSALLLMLIAMLFNFVLPFFLILSR